MANWSDFDHHVKVRLPIILGVALVSAFVTGLVTAPSRRFQGYSPEQPLPFSHLVHAGTMRIDCRYCHAGVETSRHAGVPATSVCMNCHSVARVDRPAIKQLRAEYEAGRSVVWRRIHRLPDFVYFSHNMHILAGIDCRECHGEVREMDVMAQAKPLSMGSCLGCHRNAHARVPGSPANLKGPENCSTCHR